MYPSKKASLKMAKIGGRNMWQPKLFITQGAAERSPLFGKLINSKPKKIQQIFFFISGKYTECRFTSTCFGQNITQVAALNTLGSCP